MGGGGGGGGRRLATVVGCRGAAVRVVRLVRAVVLSYLINDLVLSYLILSLMIILSYLSVACAVAVAVAGCGNTRTAALTVPSVRLVTGSFFMLDRTPVLVRSLSPSERRLGWRDGSRVRAAVPDTRSRDSDRAARGVYRHGPHDPRAAAALARGYLNRRAGSLVPGAGFSVPHVRLAAGCSMSTALAT